MWLLTIRTSFQKSIDYHPKPGITKLGRASENNIILKDKAVSRFHAEITFDPKEKSLIIQDLNSSNGIFLNGERVQSSRLEVNDQVRIGESLISVKLADTFLLDYPEKIVSIDHELSQSLLIESTENFGFLLNDLSLKLINVTERIDAILVIESFIKDMINADYCKVILAENFDELKQKGIPSSILERILKEWSPTLIANIQSDKKLAESLKSKKIHSLILLPIIVNAAPVAIIYVVQESLKKKPFARDDLQIVMAVGHQLAMAMLRFDHQRELIFTANHDPLTNLPNRTRLLDRLNHAISRSKREKDFIFALFFFDMDNFKIINDSLGHVMGDNILKKIGEELSDKFRDVDTIARIGGDEFVILYEGLKEVEDILEIAERLISCFSKPFIVEDHEIFIQVSIGATTSVMNYDTPEEALRDADIAMYHAKENGGNNFRLYDSLMHKELVTSMELQAAVRKAIPKDELVLYYQPVISLMSGKIVGFEALVRWDSPERGFLGPDRFLSALDTTGLLNQLDLWVMRQAIKDFSNLNKLGENNSPLFVSINLSEKTFFHPEITDLIDDLIKDAGITPGNLIFEITEQSNFKTEHNVLKLMNRLRSKGIKLSLDDFGTGYSTLGYLHRFPIDYLKIDKSFVQKVDQNGENSRIVHTIVNLAKQIGINVIAEGVETAEQLDFLRNIDCDLVQGYYFSHPVSIDVTLELLNRDSVWQMPA